MRNSAVKRMIAVLLCLVVFAGSELTGLTNMVGDLFAAEDVEIADPEPDVQTEEIEVEAEEEPTAPEAPAETPEVPAETPAPDDTPLPAEDPAAAPQPEASETAPETPTMTQDPADVDETSDSSDPADVPEGTIPIETPEETDPAAPADLENTADAETEEQGETEEVLTEEDLELPEDEDEEEEEWPAYENDKMSDDGKVRVYVEAEEGVLPEDAELVVKAVAAQDVEALEADESVSEEEITEARAIQEKFDAVQKELEESVAEDETREIAGFLAYDISFWVERENEETGETERMEIEPQDGKNVSVRMEFESASLPEEVKTIVEQENVQIASIDVVHMKEVKDEETGETALKAETLSEADLQTTEEAEVEEAGFIVDEFSTFTIAWVVTAGVATTEKEVTVKYVDSKGNELELEQENITVAANKEVNLYDYVHEVDGYTYEKIVLGEHEPEILVSRLKYDSSTNKFSRGYVDWKNDSSKTSVNWEGWEMTSDSSMPETIYIVYEKAESAGSGDDDKQDPVAGNRSITKTMGKGENGKYPITLTVKTEEVLEKESADIDVVLVIDRSNSMDKEGKWAATQSAAKAFVEVFLSEDKTETRRIGIVTFARESKQVLGGFSDNKEQLLKEIDDLKACASGSSEDGTNARAGLQMASDMLNDSDLDVDKKYVLFLTDGIPNVVGGNPLGSGGNYAVPYNETVQAALELKQGIDGIYTVGLLDGMSDSEKEIANRLLASKTETDPDKKCYGAREIKYSTGTAGGTGTGTGTGAGESNYTCTWMEGVNNSYADAYFPITVGSDGEDKLVETWKNIANKLVSTGSNGNGWTVTDAMSDEVTFDLEKFGEIMTNAPYGLEQSSDGKHFVKKSEDGTEFVVAEYNNEEKVIKWYLNSQLADVKVTNGEDGKKQIYEYTYTLKYYVRFNNNIQETKICNTNKETFVSTFGDEKFYPVEMPYFINVAVQKTDSETGSSLKGAKFKASWQEKTLEEIVSDADGHFSLQLEPSEVPKDRETNKLRISLEETEAPHGYLKDTVSHEIMVSHHVEFDAHGAAFGTVFVSTNDDEGSLLQLPETPNAALEYQNIPQTPWGIIVTSESVKEKHLENAIFELWRKEDGSTGGTMIKAYTAVSDKDGRIENWTPADGGEAVDSLSIAPGEYELRQIASPGGYFLNEERWTIVAEKGKDTVVTKDAAEVPEMIDSKYYRFTNAVAYELPSTGGMGIFVYTISGTLLMIAGMLILYKRKFAGRC